MGNPKEVQPEHPNEQPGVEGPIHEDPTPELESPELQRPEGDPDLTGPEGNPLIEELNPFQDPLPSDPSPFEDPTLQDPDPFSTPDSPGVADPGSVGQPDGPAANAPGNPPTFDMVEPVADKADELLEWAIESWRKTDAEILELEERAIRNAEYDRTSDTGIESWEMILLVIKVEGRSKAGFREPAEHLRKELEKTGLSELLLEWVEATRGDADKIDMTYIENLLGQIHGAFESGMQLASWSRAAFEMVKNHGMSNPGEMTLKVMFHIIGSLKADVGALYKKGTLDRPSPAEANMLRLSKPERTAEAKQQASVQTAQDKLKTAQSELKSIQVALGKAEAKLDIAEDGKAGKDLFAEMKAKDVDVLIEKLEAEVNKEKKKIGAKNADVREAQGQLRRATTAIDANAARRETLKSDFHRNLRRLDKTWSQAKNTALKSFRRGLKKDKRQDFDRLAEGFNRAFGDQLQSLDRAISDMPDNPDKMNDRAEQVSWSLVAYKGLMAKIDNLDPYEAEALKPMQDALDMLSTGLADRLQFWRRAGMI